MRSNLKRFFGIYLLMFILELIILLMVARHAGWSLNPYLTGFDTVEYSTLARNLVENFTFSKSPTAPFIPNFFRLPGYPFWLALIFWLFGSFKPAIFLGMIAFAFSAPLTYLIMREIFSEKLAVWTGALFALEPRMAFSGPFLLSEQIFMPFFLLFILWAVKFFNNPEKKNYLYFSAIFLGLAALTRGIALYLWPILLLFLFFSLYSKGWSGAKIAGVSLTATLILFIFIFPWAIRNRLVFGTWQPSSILGTHLYWGHLETLERYLGVSQEESHGRVLKRAAQLAGPNLETPQAVSVLAQSALSEIKSHWLAYLKVYVFNLGLFFVTDGYKGVLSYVAEIRPNYLNLGDFLIKFQFREFVSYLRNFSWSELILPIFGRLIWLVLTISSFLGFSISFKKMSQRRLILSLFLSLIFYFAIMTGPIFSPDPRFRMPVNGFLIAFALVSIFHIFRIDFKYDKSY